jgi:Leucine-rich repeat (LRR) protein
MISGIKLEDGEYGRRAVITSAWSDEITRFLTSEKIVDLELNYAKGWKGRDLSFLAALPNLRWFKMVDFTISSVEPIHFLKKLRGLEVMTYCKTELRFAEFPRLEDCGLEWRPKATSLFGCKTLKKLFVNRYKGTETDPFAQLTNLESLAILNSPIRNLRGLSELKELRSLRLANLPRLTSLAGIEGLTKLEELDINTCRGFNSIEEIGHLSRLRKLHLNNDGRIDSLKPLDKLSRLESALFYESTDIGDGDLSPLLRQKHLANVSFRNRRHYTHAREMFTQYENGSVGQAPSAPR